MAQTSIAAERPGGRADATRGRILKAALVEFAEKGMAGARVDEIALRASANKRMIYAYFGSKEDLWLAVLERVYNAKREKERALDFEGLSPTHAMREMVRFNLRYTAAHPEFVRLLNEENLNRAVHLRRSEEIRALYNPLLDQLRAVLALGESEGSFRSGVDPMQLYITLVGICHFYIANQYTLSTVFGAGLTSEGALAAREDHCCEVVLGFLRP